MQKLSSGPSLRRRVVRAQSTNAAGTSALTTNCAITAEREQITESKGIASSRAGDTLLLRKGASYYVDCK